MTEFNFATLIAETQSALQAVADEAKAKLDAFLAERFSSGISDRDFVSVLSMSIVMSGLNPSDFAREANLDSRTVWDWINHQKLPSNQSLREVYVKLFMVTATSEIGLVTAMDNLSSCPVNFFPSVVSSEVAEPATPVADEATEAPPSVDKLPFDPWISAFALEFSTRTRNCLINDNVSYLGQLVQKTESEMLRWPNFAGKSLNEVKEVLREKFGLGLGMRHPELDAFNEELKRREPEAK